MRGSVGCEYPYFSVLDFNDVPRVKRSGLAPVWDDLDSISVSEGDLVGCDLKAAAADEGFHPVFITLD